MRWAWALAVAAPAILAGGGGAGAAPAAPAVPAHGGAHTNIYVVPPAGGIVTRITANGEGADERLAYDPSWSRDGRRLVFAEVACHSCRSEIQVVASRPSPQGRRGRTIAAGFDPAWSPDGRWIAFVGAGGGIYRIRPDGSGRRLIVKGGLADDSPSWSPDAKQIVFTEQETASRWRLYVVGAGGVGRVPLATGDGPAVDPAWSPDGRRIAFARQRGIWQIATVPARGGRVRVVSRGSGSDSSPSWSRDSRHLVFVRQQRFGTAIYAMDVAGRHLRRITPRSMAVAVGPAWSPGGSRIAFAGDTKG
jgi:Tol biopolymer transport system component